MRSIIRAADLRGRKRNEGGKVSYLARLEGAEGSPDLASGKERGERRAVVVNSRSTAAVRGGGRQLRPLPLCSLPLGFVIAGDLVMRALSPSLSHHVGRGGNGDLGLVLMVGEGG